MEKLSMCRICLAENIRMYVVVNEKLHELYEMLTGIPFVTEDSRPMLACFICCTKLKQFCQLQRKCLEAEELFTQMMNEHHEQNLFTNQELLKSFNGFIRSPMEHLSIVDEFLTECDAVKEELPAVRETLIVELKEEHLSDDLELESLYSSHFDIDDIPAQQSEPHPEYDVPLIEIKVEEVEEEQDVASKKRRASDATRAVVAKKRKLLIRRNKPEDVIKEKQKNGELDTKVNTQNKIRSKLVQKLDEPSTSKTPRANNKKQTRIRTGGATYKCDICQYSCNSKGDLIKHIRVHTGEKPYKCEECHVCFTQKSQLTRHIRTHAGEKPYKCEECELCFSRKKHLTEHTLTHTGEKPFKCEECQFCFTQKGHLTRHMRTHTGEKPYKCEECELCFSEKSNLRSHIRTHTGEQPYKCKECQFCFSQRSHLTRHVRTYHGKKP